MVEASKQGFRVGGDHVGGARIGGVRVGGARVGGAPTICHCHPALVTTKPCIEWLTTHLGLLDVLFQYDALRQTGTRFYKLPTINYK